MAERQVEASAPSERLPCASMLLICFLLTRNRLGHKENFDETADFMEGLIGEVMIRSDGLNSCVFFPVHP